MASLKKRGYVHLGWGKCRDCLAEIEWYEGPKGKKICFSNSGKPHWKVCPMKHLPTLQMFTLAQELVKEGLVDAFNSYVPPKPSSKQVYERYNKRMIILDDRKTLD